MRAQFGEHYGSDNNTHLHKYTYIQSVRGKCIDIANVNGFLGGIRETNH